MPRPDLGFAALELRRLRILRTPRGVQRALDATPYHTCTTAWTLHRVLSEWTAHCLEGAVFGAAALRVLGFPPLLLGLQAVQDTDHAIAVFRRRGHWGATAKSNFSALRAYSRPVNLAPFDRAHLGWMTADQEVSFIPPHLVRNSHRPLLIPVMIRGLSRVDRRSLQAGLVGYRPH